MRERVRNRLLRRTVVSSRRSGRARASVPQRSAQAGEARAGGPRTALADGRGDRRCLTTLRILQLHNHHAAKGGAMEVLEHERQLLTAAGHEVEQLTLPAAEDLTLSPLRQGAKAVWNREFAKATAQKLSRGSGPISPMCTRHSPWCRPRCSAQPTMPGSRQSPRSTASVGLCGRHLCPRRLDL